MWRRIHAYRRKSVTMLFYLGPSIHSASMCSMQFPAGGGGWWLHGAYRPTASSPAWLRDRDLLFWPTPPKAGTCVDQSLWLRAQVPVSHVGDRNAGAWALTHCHLQRASAGCWSQDSSTVPPTWMWKSQPAAQPHSQMPVAIFSFKWNNTERNMSMHTLFISWRWHFLDSISGMDPFSLRYVCHSLLFSPYQLVPLHHLLQMVGFCPQYSLEAWWLVGNTGLCAFKLLPWVYSSFFLFKYF